MAKQRVVKQATVRFYEGEESLHDWLKKIAKKQGRSMEYLLKLWAKRERDKNP